MRADELYKFLDETLKKVQDELHHRILDFRLEYNKEMPRRKWTAIDRKSRHGPSDAMHNPPQPLKVSQKTLVSFLTEITLISIDFLTPS
ncbi:hypothetical protein Tco_0795948 [Tanacetum coccineum]